MKHWERLSVSVDADLLAIGRYAVAEGRADSLSAWVNDALRLKAEHDRRMKGLHAFLDAYEAEQGDITRDEIDAATRNFRRKATVVRSASGTSAEHGTGRLESDP